MTLMALTQGEDPQLVIGPLRIWIHGRQFPGMKDYWDGNWILTTAQVEEEGARVTVYGPILHLPELRTWLGELETLHKNLKGTAELPTMEPNLRVALRAEALGRIEAEVELTPNHLSQEHRFSFAVDQSFLPQLCWSIRQVLKDFPIVGRPGE